MVSVKRCGFCIRCSFLDASVISPLLQMSAAIIICDERLLGTPLSHSTQSNAIVPYPLQSSVHPVIMQLPVTEFCDLVSFRLVMGYSDINDILDLFVFILETFDFFPQKIHTVYS